MNGWNSASSTMDGRVLLTPDRFLHLPLLHTGLVDTVDFRSLGHRAAMGAVWK